MAKFGWRLPITLTKDAFFCSRIMSMRFVFVILSIIGFIQFGQAQDDAPANKKLVRVETFRAQVQVIGVLEGRSDLAVVKVKQVEENKWNLKVGDEILTTFYFTTEPTNGRKKYPGVEISDHIVVNIRGEMNSNGVQVDYTVFDYRKLKVTTIPVTPEVPQPPE